MENTEKRKPGRPKADLRKTDDVIPQTEHAKEVIKKTKAYRKANEEVERYYKINGAKLVLIIVKKHGTYSRFIGKLLGQNKKGYGEQAKFLAKLKANGELR